MKKAETFDFRFRSSLAAATAPLSTVCVFTFLVIDVQVKWFISKLNAISKIGNAAVWPYITISSLCLSAVKSFIFFGHFGNHSFFDIELQL
jgi:hypothetical protein